MSLDVGKIIPLTTAISPAGLGFANFAKAYLFAPQTELPEVGFNTDSKKTYTSLPALGVDFADTTETYKAAARWLGGIPATNELVVYGVATADATITETLNKARNKGWWFFSFFTADVYADAAKVEAIAAWSETNAAFFMNCQTGVSAAEIRDENDELTIANTLTTAGYRLTNTFPHATDPYAGIALCKHFAAVNYQAAGTTITGEYKKLAGVASEELSGSEIAAMQSATKKCTFYTNVETAGSLDTGRVINTLTHSSYGEYIDDVINLEAFSNNLKVALYNAIANQPKKLGQDPQGQAVLIGTARSICELYISNNFLGARNYLDPDDGVNKFTVGYEILTKPEEILNLLTPNRAAREAAPLRIRIFRKGAIHTAPVDISVY